MTQQEIFTANFNKLLERSGYRTCDVENYCKVSRATVCGWKNGTITPRMDKIEKLSQLFGVRKSALIDSSSESIHAGRLKPRLGTIACGAPILAEENIDSYDDVPEYINCDFTLKCKGDSMKNARIESGDIVCIRQQPAVENGEIAAVLIGNEATLKRVKYIQYGIILMPENTDYEPMIFTGEDVNSVKILGKATYFISKIK